MPDSFIYETSPVRVIFAAGSISRTGAEMTRLGLRRALLLSTPEQAGLLADIGKTLGELAAGYFNGAAMHTPGDVTEDALRVLKSCNADCLLAVGGGSTTGLGKALARRTGLTQIVVPTTYAGSEMTPILGETVNGLKTTIRGPEIQPEVVIYDVDLTLSLPPRLSTASGLNAIAHAVEALYARDGNPVVSLMAEEGIAALARSLPIIQNDPADARARSDALYGAWLCGACLGSVGMALHHKICHVLGGAFNLKHAETHSVMLPYVMAYNSEAAPQAMHRIGRALGTEDAVSGMYALATLLVQERSLKTLGMPEQGIELAVSQTMQNQYWNPRPAESDAIRNMLKLAWHGEPPRPV